MTEPRSNLAQGRESFDAKIGDSLVPFFNRNVTPYATESSGPKFDLIPVEKQKDIMVNVARMYAQQEYNRIIELVDVLQKQAEKLKRRLELTDAIHSAQYKFQIYHGRIYWLVFDSEEEITRLIVIGPHEWSTSAPDKYTYICGVKWLGDHTWIEVDEKGNHVT